MKQIFDWMREQIEAKTSNIGIRGIDGHHNVIGSCVANDIINEAEAKWELDCCEWNFYEVDVLTAHGMYEYKGCVKQWKYCPFCGKPIKISEVE